MTRPYFVIFIYVIGTEREMTAGRCLSSHQFKVVTEPNDEIIVMEKMLRKKKFNSKCCFTEFGIAVIPVRLHGGLKNAEKLFPN